MPAFTLVTVLGAAATNNNIFAGSAFEFMSRPSRVQIAMVGSVAGGLATVQFGPEVQLENGELMIERGAAGSGPSLADDMVIDDIATAGDRLVARITDGAGAGMTVFTRVRVTPVA